MVSTRGLVLTPRANGLASIFLADVLRLEFLQRNRSDDAVMVARRRQEHRHRAGHDDGVQNGFVAVAIHDHHVAGRHGGVPHHLVRGGGAVGDEKQVVGVENPRGVAFAGRDRAGVVEQLAQFVHRVAHVGAQHVLAEELVEHLSHRALEESHAAGVAGAVPGIGAIGGVMRERAEERRRQGIQVVPRFPRHIAGDELRGVLEHVDEAVQFLQHVIGDVARGAGLAVEENRDFGVAAADFHDKGTNLRNSVFRQFGRGEFLVVDRQDEGGGAALLLGK